MLTVWARPQGTGSSSRYVGVFHFPRWNTSNNLSTRPAVLRRHSPVQLHTFECIVRQCFHPDRLILVLRDDHERLSFVFAERQERHGKENCRFWKCACGDGRSRCAAAVRGCLGDGSERVNGTSSRVPCYMILTICSSLSLGFTMLRSTTVASSSRITSAVHRLPLPLNDLRNAQKPILRPPAQR